MKKLITRTVSGIVYIALIIGALYLGGWWWYALTALFTVLATLEYQNIQAKRNGTQLTTYNRALDMAAALTIWAAAPVCTSSCEILLALIVMLGVYVLLRTVLSLRKSDGDTFNALASSLFGVLYIAIPLSLLNFVMHYSHDNAAYILWMFALIWINDTGAYCVGSTLGKHRLCERLSPKKSWEGFWGGMLFCIIASLIYAYISKTPMLANLILAVIVSAFATLGDLFESMLKRSAGVKDAGNIIPGHGGVLDRIDSLLFVAPAVAIFMAFMLA